jgi:hypothetical protein
MFEVMVMFKVIVMFEVMVMFKVIVMFEVIVMFNKSWFSIIGSKSHYKNELCYVSKLV